ncbi:MAG: type II toxin-antitoxin system VapC family toxin [Dehalococcoidia bacterium]
MLLIEAHAAILSALGIARGARFLRDIDASATTIVHVRARDELRAKEITYRYSDKDFSFVDALSFAVMERLHISRAFTFDHDFEQYGLTMLTPGRF